MLVCGKRRPSPLGWIRMRATISMRDRDPPPPNPIVVVLFGTEAEARREGRGGGGVSSLHSQPRMGQQLVAPHGSPLPVSFSNLNR